MSISKKQQAMNEDLQPNTVLESLHKNLNSQGQERVREVKESNLKLAQVLNQKQFES